MSLWTFDWCFAWSEENHIVWSTKLYMLSEQLWNPLKIQRLPDVWVLSCSQKKNHGVTLVSISPVNNENFFVILVCVGFAANEVVANEQDDWFLLPIYGTSWPWHSVMSRQRARQAGTSHARKYREVQQSREAGQTISHTHKGKDVPIATQNLVEREWSWTAFFRVALVIPDLDSVVNWRNV